MQIFHTRTRLLVASFAIVLLNNIVTMAQDEKANTVTPSATVDKPQWTAEQKQIVDLSQAFDVAYSNGDVETIMNMLTDDVRIADEFGDVYEGKQAVKDLYSTAFTNQPGTKLTTSVESVRFVTSNVVVEEGVSYVSPSDGDVTTVTYQAVYVKTDAGWKLSQIRDFAAPTPKDSGVHSEYLTILDWLAGEWVVETPSGVVHMSAQWIDEGNALQLLFTRPTESGPKIEARVRIGYDPRARQIHSWTFDTAGGHGDSSWAKVQDQNTWLLKNEAVMPDGKIVSASQLITVDPSGDKFTWTTFDRSIDGVVSTSREDTVVTRQAPKPKPAKTKTTEKNEDAAPSASPGS